MSDSITVVLTLSNVPNSPRVPLEITSNDSPAILRKKASEATNIPLESIRLIFRGRLVGSELDKKVIEEYKLETDSVIHCMGKPVETTVASTVASAGSSVTVRAHTVAPEKPAATDQATFANALTTIQTSNSSSVYMTAVQTLEKILSNIADNPMEEKYRKVKRANAAFNKRVGAVPGGEAAMLAVGFSMETIDGESFFVMHPRPEAWPMLLQHRAELVIASQSAANAASSSPPLPIGGMPPALGMPAMPAGMPTMTPQMQQAAAQMMNDPQQLQAMLQDPMVQNMLRNDPRLANNPMMQQAVEQLSSNPQMLAQVSQMMQNPNLNNGVGGLQQATLQGGASNRDGPTDQEMTEEEMLEEAIRRSLMDI